MAYLRIVKRDGVRHTSINDRPKWYARGYVKIGSKPHYWKRVHLGTFATRDEAECAERLFAERRQTVARPGNP